MTSVRRTGGIAGRPKNAARRALCHRPRNHTLFALIPPVVLGAPLDALEPQRRGSVSLAPCASTGSAQQMLCGTYDVFENRATRRGRVITLNLAVLPARHATPKPDPIFYLAGGPGGSAVRRAASYADSPLRRVREMVFVDQRGTGESNPLPCELPGSAENPQGYLDGDFARVKPFRQCKRQLKKIADLRLYSTPVAVDDIDEVRAAMGYPRINLLGTSWGSRTGLVYLRRHPESIRSAVFESAVPLAITYPLYHAQGAQQALDAVLAECAADNACAAAYPDPTGELQAVLARLAAAPATVTIQRPDSAAPIDVVLSSSAFAEGVRYLLFVAPEYLPLMIHLAERGDYRPLTQFAVDYLDGLRGLKIGQLLSVVCPADVARIDPADIPRLTDNTFMGDLRVQQTIAICKVWPQAEMPPGYGEPVRSEVPTLLWSGAFDSASRPAWVDAAAQYLPNSLHLVVDAAHSPSGACVDKITQKFFDRGSVQGLPTGCARKIRLPPFALPQ